MQTITYAQLESLLSALPGLKSYRVYRAIEGDLRLVVYDPDGGETGYFIRFNDVGEPYLVLRW